MAALTKAVYDSALQEDEPPEPTALRLLPGGATAAALLIVIIIIGLLSRSRRQAELAVLHAERDNLNERQRQADLQAAESARQIQTLQHIQYKTVHQIRQYHAYR